MGGLEIEVSDYALLEQVNDNIRGLFDEKSDRYGNMYYSRTVEEVYPQIFAWLDLLDVNVWVILILMVGVAGFTMISGLLIIILERTNMIGVLKALGADNTAVRKIFFRSPYFLSEKVCCGKYCRSFFLYSTVLLQNRKTRSGDILCRFCSC